jgi:HK97 family phage portal protein
MAWGRGVNGESVVANFKDRLRVAAKMAVGVFSENAAKEAYGLLSGIMPGGIGYPPTRGTKQWLEAYGQMPWLRAVAGRVANAIAATEWELYVAKKKGAPKATRDIKIQRASAPRRHALIKSAKDREEMTQLDNHVLLDTVRNANTFQTGGALWKITQLHLDLAGEAYWVKERDGLGTVVGLWPVPPNWIMNTPTPTNRFFRVGFRGWQGYIPDTEILWFSDPDPSNPYGRGSGSVQALADELETDEYIAKHTKAFFFNRAKPDLVIYPKAPQVMRPADAARLEEDWLSRNQGFWRAFKPYFLTREVGIQELDQNFRSLTLVQLREFERNAIIQMFGMPPELLGVIENSNRATIDAADYLFSKYVIVPRLEFIRAILQERLVPEYDERLIVDYVSPIQDDKEQQLKAAIAMPASITVNEWRELQGFEKLEGPEGDAHLIPSTVKPGSLDKVIEQNDNPPAPQVQYSPDGQPVLDPKNPPPPLPQPEPKQPGEKPKRARAHEWMAELRAEAKCARDAGDSELEAAFLAKAAESDDDLPAASEAAMRQERAFIRHLMDAWTAAMAAADLPALRAASGSHDIEGMVAALHPEIEAQRVSSAVSERDAEAFRRGAVLALDELGGRPKAAKDDGFTMDLTAVNEQAVRWAAARAAALVVARRAVREQVRVLVTRAIEEGIAPDDLARLLRDVVGLLPGQAQAVANFRGRLSGQGVGGDILERRVERYAQAQRRRRAMTIARTELISATNAGQQALWRQASTQGLLGDDLGKIWIVCDDERLEAHCEALGEMDPVRIDDEFEPGLEYPPAHPNCRCAVGLVNMPRRG